MTTPDNPDAGAENAQDELTAPPEDAVPADASTGQPEPPAESDTQATDTPPEPPAAESGERKLRKRAQTAEAERDRLREQVAGYQRREVEALAGSTLADPRDIWAGGVTLPECLTDDGDLDPERVTAAVAKVVDAHPHWKVQLPDAAAPASAVTSDGNPHDETDQEQAASWQEAFRQAAQR
ncbi:hypothetical protein ABGB19_02095 [Mycobacterium sp. B14F4]|uniref:hypothetical protein n=1 Tax=Mycobacterium sp. B14F4 TaxID=3153565 RepID=UPI00325F6B22